MYEHERKPCADVLALKHSSAAAAALALLVRYCMSFRCVELPEQAHQSSERLANRLRRQDTDAAIYSAYHVEKAQM